ncbi:PEP-CTERM sorting domain-containing protein [Janthinobacterium aquaticum]|uniref:PEP-CTERM sorting domain-containing protein n=1 Tax=Janthinobacterium sp. FT58W TaxID=2654254 RepID=UPI00126404BD|nr:PEP-CTERM sorting domain-containing protein [Janthinobacterium sp. FT58W]KAB8043273.1 hypothetical protein GCM43_08055 [Janthinobacterium sp. FT58W]
MNASHWTCLYLLAACTSMPAQAAGILEHDAGVPVMVNDSTSLNNQFVWQEPELPYVRLLADDGSSRVHWSAPAHPMPGMPHVLAQPVPAMPVAAEVPEASMVSMLLVGLGLLALGVHGERQEKFQEAPRPHL